MRYYNNHKKFLYVVWMIPLIILTVQSSPIELPRDEGDLGAFVEEGVIDSFQYEQLLVFYALPISVPQGELAYLVRVFPEIEDILPSQEQIDEYQPFDNHQIQKLFGDFPILANFEPILRFNAAPPPSPRSGEVVLGINKSPIDELRGQRARFRYKSSLISTEGSVALTDSGAMWQSRRVSLSHKNIDAHVGNYRQPVPGELMLGRFSAMDYELTNYDSIDSISPDNRSITTQNWLYANSNTWNGASVNIKNIPGVSALGVTAFGHIRPGERGGGGGVDININKKWRGFVGVTGFELMGRGDTAINEHIYNAHLYGEYYDKTWRISSELGMPVNDDNLIPAVSISVNYRLKNTYAQYGMICYPHDFYAPISRVNRLILSEIGIKEGEQSPSIIKHSLKSSIPLTEMIKVIPELDFTESGGAVKRVYGRAEARARSDWADIAVKHSSKIFTAEIDSAAHTSSASIYLRSDYTIDFRGSYQYVYGYYANARNTYTAELIGTIIPNTVIAPFITGRYVTDHAYRFGVKTELHLYKKTWTSITIEIPAGVKGDDNVYIKGSSSYAF